MMKWVIPAAIILLLFLVFWYYYMPNYLFSFLIKRKSPRPGSPALAKVRAVSGPREDYSWLDTVPYETISVRSHDGLLLKGLYLAASAGNSPRGLTMILAHGYGGQPRQLSEIARSAHTDLGCNVLLPYARGYGESEGDYIGFGWLDRLDYLKWIDWVKERASSPAGIVLFGLSMGGATVLNTGGEALPPEVKAIIDDCGFSSIYDEIWHQLQRSPFRSLDLLNRTSKLVKKRTGYSFEEASTLDQVRKITVPTLFIHGDADTFVPFEMGCALYEACPAPKEFYIVKGAGHGQASVHDPEEYRRRITQFLREHNL